MLTTCNARDKECSKMLFYNTVRDIVFIQGVLLPVHSSGCSRRCDSPVASNTGRLLLLSEEKKGQILVYVGNGRSCWNDMFIADWYSLWTLCPQPLQNYPSLSHSVSLVYPVTPCLILSQKQGVFFISAQFNEDGKELGSLN